MTGGPPEICRPSPWAPMLSPSRDQQLAPQWRGKHQPPNRTALHQEVSYFSVYGDLDRQAGPQAFTVRQHKKWGLARLPPQACQGHTNQEQTPGGLTITYRPDSQANSSCISELRRHVVGTEQGMVGVETEGLREAKNKETSIRCKVSKVQSPRAHSQVDGCTPRHDFDNVGLCWLQF